MNLPNRKPIRLKNFNYSEQGVYFITICVKDKKCILSQIVGDGVIDVPEIKLLDYGKIAEKQILSINEAYDFLNIESYVIMPNHIHLLVKVLKRNSEGMSGTPSPTNMEIPKLVSTFKRFCNKTYGENIWQRGYNDRIIRDEADYIKHLEYIKNNTLKWNKDKYYI